MNVIATAVKQFAESIQWITNACVKFRHNGKTIYIDPWKLTKPDSADLILITHAHFDHFSVDDIKLIASNKTTLICTPDVAPQAQELGVAKVVAIAPFEQTVWNDIKISTVPMYNVVKDNFHNRNSGWVGYIINVGGITLYHTGDTERIPEMKDVRCDVMLLPIGQTYTMNSVDEAAQAVLDTHAKIAIPMHYDVHESEPGDPQRLAKILEGKVEVMIKTPTQ